MNQTLNRRTELLEKRIWKAHWIHGNINGKNSANISEAVNAMALYGNLTSVEQKESIFRNVFSSSFDIYCQSDIKKSGPPFSIYVLMGLCLNARYDIALDYMRWRHGSAREQGLDTMPEAWIFNSVGGESAAQGTLAAAYVLSTEILGIKPLDPGFQRIIIKPQPCGLKWAEGILPTIKGPISVRWYEKGNDFFIDVEIPYHVTTEIHLPYKGQDISVSGLEQNGNRLYEMKESDGRPMVLVSARKCSISIKGIVQEI